MDKTAVDQKTEKYWENYFGQYGKTFVRTIPRRIKAALGRSLKANTVEGSVAPIAKQISENDTLSIEAAFKGTIDGKNSTILITAEFSDEGKMNKFEACRLI